MFVKRFRFSEGTTELILSPNICVVPALKASERYELIRGFASIVSPLNTKETSNFVELDVCGKVELLEYDFLAEKRIFDVVRKNYILSRDILAAIQKNEVEIPEFNPQNINIVKLLKATPEGKIPRLDEQRSLYAKKFAEKTAHSVRLKEVNAKLKELERELIGSYNTLTTYKQILLAPFKDAENEKKEILLPLRTQQNNLSQQMLTIEKQIVAYQNSNLARLEDILDLAKQEAYANGVLMAEALSDAYDIVVSQEEELTNRGISLESVLENYNQKKEEYDILKEKIDGPQTEEEDIRKLESLHHHIKNHDKIYNGVKNAPTLNSLELLEQDLLNKMGFATWSSYLMADQLAASDPWIVRECEIAEKEFKKAEGMWLRVYAEVQSLDGYMENLEYMDSLQSQAKLAVGYAQDEDVPVEKVVTALQSSMLNSVDETPLGDSLKSIISSFGIMKPDSKDIVHMIQIAEHLLEEGSIQNIIGDLFAEKEKIFNQITVTEKKIIFVEDQLLGEKDNLVVKIVKEEVFHKKIEKTISITQNSLEETQKFFEAIDEELFALQRKINDIMLEEAKRSHDSEFAYYKEAEPSDENKISNLFFSLFASLRDVKDVESIPVLVDDIFSDLSEELSDFVLRQILIYSDIAQIVIMSDAQIVARWLALTGDPEKISLVRVEQVS